MRSSPSPKVAPIWITPPRRNNHSCSHRNVLRGLHYQLGRPQGKLVRVLSGHIWDVAVDLLRPCRTRQVGEERNGLIPRERRVAQQRQPVRVGLTRQQLCRALPHTLGMLAPHEPPMVQEELQQSQVVGPQMTAQEEVVP